MFKPALLEIGFEEIPAAYIQPAMAQAKTLCEKLLAENALNAQEIEIFATARRITLLISGLAEKSAERTEEFVGPSLKAGIDANGGFTGAAKGFASKHGIKPEALLKVQTEKGEYLAVKKVIPGEKTQNLLSVIFTAIISQLYFPKTMVWEGSGFRFARPLRNIVALFGDKTVKLQLAGVKASNTTFGLHTSGTKSIAIKSPEKYLSTLRNNCIIASTIERRTALVKAVSSAAKRLKCIAIPDEDLFDEVNFLVEHPVAVVGNFDEKYLSIPKEVLINCMRKKQKFFALENEQGELTNNFIGIRNGISEYQDVVRDGYERVLKARLADAEFFFNKDTATPLFNKVEKLNGVVFQKELGTVYEKMQRVIKI
ncbi:MAG: glycine--tRNA ligase subunit beta, partial [Endomicrobiales bacterium]|nr:glycine--tRNA ligase subunit beta [Endomicrobiales bacterium]